MNKDAILRELCDEIHEAEFLAKADRKREIFGDNQFLEHLLLREDGVSVEIFREKTNHHLPHIHISHSDNFDISLNLNDFSVIEGGPLDRHLRRHLLPRLQARQAELLAIWRELNDVDNSIRVTEMISNLRI